jgi:predicted PurR-regulated permease PerM
MPDSDDAPRGQDEPVEPPRPEPEEPVTRAEADAERMSTPEEPLGHPGPPLNQRSPFVLSMAAAAGVAMVAAAIWLIIIASSELILIGLAFLLAVGIEPIVSWLVRLRWPRGLAVTAVVLLGLSGFAGLLVGLVPILVQQGGQFAGQVPAYLRAAQDQGTLIGQLNARLHLQQALEQQTSGEQALRLAGGLLGVGQAVFGAVTSTFVVTVLAVYFLATMPRIRQTLYRLVPARRRPRVVLLGDAIFTRVGAYLLGNVLISVIAGVATIIVLLILNVPYPYLLAVLVAILDLVPVVGSITAGVIVTLAALTVSLPAALVTAGFFVAYRFLEDYVLVPTIIGRAVKVPATVTLVAVLLGFALYGIIGMLVAVPVAAGVHLLLHEVVFPRLDRSGPGEPPPNAHGSQSEKR